MSLADWDYHGSLADAVDTIDNEWLENIQEEHRDLYHKQFQRNLGMPVKPSREWVKKMADKEDNVNYDRHTMNAAEWHRCPPSEVTPHMRNLAKMRCHRFSYGTFADGGPEGPWDDEISVPGAGTFTAGEIHGYPKGYGGPAEGARSVMTLTCNGIELWTQSRKSKFFAECFEKLMRESSPYREMFMHISKHKKQQDDKLRERKKARPNAAVGYTATADFEAPAVFAPYMPLIGGDSSSI